MVALASAFVRVRPQVDKREFQKAGEQGGAAAGQGAGKAFGEQYTRGADGRLRDSRGRFVKDSEAAGRSAGGKAGKGFGDTFGKESKGAFSSLKSNLKLAAGVFVPLGLGAAVAEIGKIGIAYEDNMNIFQVVSKATAQQMDQVAAKARALGADVTLPGVSAAGAADAMTELAKAGFTVQESMDAAKGTLQLARIANIDEGKAAEIAANAVNAFGIQAKDTSFVVDELAAAANSSSIEISDASDAFKMAAAVYSGLQGPVVGSKEAITELNTAVAILGNNGIKGSDAGTSLKQAMLQLTGPTAQAKDIMRELAYNAAQANIPLDLQNQILHGGKKEREAALAQIEKLNPSMQNLGDIAYDSSGKMRPLRDIIGLVQQGTKGLTQEERNYAVTQIFGADASRSILALLKGGLPVYDAQRKAILQQGAAAEFAAAKNKGLGGAIDNVKSQFENAAISVYSAVKGPLTQSLNNLATVLPVIFAGIGKFSGFVSDNIVVIRDWALAIGAVTLALKINSAMLAVTAAGGLLEYAKGIKIVTTTTKAWAAAQALLNASLIANPVGLIIVAIVALGAALVLLFRHNETFRKIVLTVWGAIKTAIAATVDWIVHTAWPAIVTAYKAIAAAALWLWHNVFEPVWNGIMKVVNFVVAAVKFYIKALEIEFHVIATVAIWLWQHVFSPVFAAIRKIVEIWWLAVQIVFKALSNILVFVVGKAVTYLRGMWDASFAFIRDRIVLPWWKTIQTIFNAFRTYIYGPIVAALTRVRAGFVVVFNAVSAAVENWWKAHISPIFANVRRGWDVVVAGFKSGASTIAKVWQSIQEAARKPVAFVVNHVINPFINGLNSAARIVGVKDQVSPIKGFASGGKISGAGGMTDNRQAVIPGVGAVQLQGGEFVVDRQNTAKALPLLRWVNAGMKGGAREIMRYLGKPLADMPGDGSEGWAFKDGGLVGWLGDVWGAISHPAQTIKKPFEAALSKIPGAGMLKDFLIGSAKRLLNGAVSWLTGIGGGGGNLGKATQFLRAQNGKPYVWASAGPGGYDCSGIVSAVWNIMHNRAPYNHTFSTSNAGTYFPKPGNDGPLAAAWSHPGQAPAGSSVGHMMGRLGALTFESSGSRGVHLGTSTRRMSDFANIGHYRNGGLFGEPIRLFDSGGFWPSGTLGANLSGRTEYVQSRPGQDAGVVINFHERAFAGAIVSDSKAAEDMVVKAVKSARTKRRI